MLGVVAGHDMQVEFTGDASLCRRPMGRVLAPLTAMGLQTDADEDHATLPLVVRGTARSPAHRLRPAGAVGASEVGGAARRHACAGPHHRGRAVGEPRSHRAHARLFRRRADRRGSRAGRARRDHLRRRRASWREHRRAGRSKLGRLHDRRRADLAALGHRGRERAAQSDAERLHRDLARDGRRHRAARPPPRRRRDRRRSPHQVERAQGRARAARAARPR